MRHTLVTGGIFGHVEGLQLDLNSGMEKTSVHLKTWRAAAGVDNTHLNGPFKGVTLIGQLPDAWIRPSVQSYHIDARGGAPARGP